MLQHLLLFETMAYKIAALSVKSSIKQLFTCFFRLQPHHSKHTGSRPGFRCPVQSNSIFQKIKPSCFLEAKIECIRTL